MVFEDVYSKAWKTVLKSAEMYRLGLNKGVEISTNLGRTFSRVFVLGVGGSGIVGDIVSALKEHDANTEVITVRALKTPRIDTDTLVIAVSYSGDTAETVTASVDALSKGARVIGISTGGRLTSILTSRGAQVARVSQGLQPRYAVPEMVGLLYGILSNHEGFSLRTFVKAVDELNVFLKQFDDVENNPAKTIAKSLIGKTVVCLAHGHLSPAAQRLKAQLNENAKHPAYTSLLPEACHNEIEGWTDIQHYAYMLQRSVFEPKIYSDAFDWMKKFIDSHNGVCHEIRLYSENHVSELLKHVGLADLMSVGLASLKKTDPFELTIIPMLRPLLRKHLP